ncbi:MAG TPA: hypothetical protein VK445_07460 [Dissulfurispiraceae bacterium]|nr:hypothetical protein [Dissulfurispiraceae bacterium]
MNEHCGLKKRLLLISAAVLLAGIVSGVVIYLVAPNSDDISSMDDSKMYRHNLELYGGKLNVLANELVQGFYGLWRGRVLAFTLAGLSAIVSLGLFLYARSLPPDA